MKTIDTVEKDIKSLTVQGATNVALAVLDALESILRDTPDIQPETLKEIGMRLAYARPTEPLAQNAIRYIFSGEDSYKTKIQKYRAFIEAGKKSIPTNGKHLLVDGGSYLTICHSSTTVALFHAARAQGAFFAIYVAETRPLYQGRITAKELLEAGFDDVTMIIDDVAVSLIEGRIGKIDAVFVGADLLTETGFVNKVGTLAVAAAAHRNGIPVYCLTTLLKYDPRKYDPTLIEKRGKEEIWKEAPKKLKFYAPAFDYVPYFPNVHVVCETGIIAGDKVTFSVKKKYPFIPV